MTDNNILYDKREMILQAKQSTEEMCAFFTSKKEKNLSETGKNCQKYMVLSTDIMKQVIVQDGLWQYKCIHFTSC